MPKQTLMNLEEGVVINAHVDIDFNMGTLIATDNVDIFTVNNRKGKRWAGCCLWS